MRMEFLKKKLSARYRMNFNHIEAFEYSNEQLDDSNAFSCKKWNAFNAVTNCLNAKAKIHFLGKSFGEIITKPLENANHMNYIFNHLGTFMFNKGKRTFRVETAIPFLSNCLLRVLTRQECLKVIHTLNKNKPLGVSNIPALAQIFCLVGKVDEN